MSADPSRPLAAEIVHSDCVEYMRTLPASSVDLVFTSPPYADARLHTYGGCPPSEYVEWFMPVAAEIKRVLKPTGSFVLNIKECVTDGQRDIYVLDLIMALREIEFRWIEEYIWAKKNAMPGKWPNRFRDSWERLLHFTLCRKFKMRQNSVMVPADPERKRWLMPKSRSKVAHERKSRATKSKFEAKDANWYGRMMTYPGNVIYGGVVSTNKGHSAAMPEYLPEFFVKLLTDEGDLVLDPFCGSGTTCYVAKNLKRATIGIDKDANAVAVAQKRMMQELLL